MVLVERRSVQSWMDTATVVVIAGEQDVRHPLWQHWSQQLGKELDFKQESVIQQYSHYTGHHILQGHAKLLSINGFTVCLLRPIGEFANHYALLQCVKKASGIYSHDRVSNEKNIHNILEPIFDQTKICPKGRAINTQLQALQGVDFIITVDGEFIERNLEENLIKNGVKYSVIDQLQFNYEEGDSQAAAKATCCWALCQFAVINSTVFAFVNNSGPYSDASALQGKIREWFPRAKQLLPPEQAIHFFAQASVGPVGARALQDPVKALTATLQATIIAPPTEAAVREPKDPSKNSKL